MSSSGTGTGTISSSGAEADLDAALARLSGPDLVTHLRATCRRADYDAAARVLADRDRRLAHAEAALDRDLPDMKAQVQVLEERYRALKAEQGRGPSSGRSSSGGAIAIAAAAPRVDDRGAEEPGPIIDLCSSDDDDDEELEEGEFRPPGIAVAGVSCERNEEAASVGDDEGSRAGFSCERKDSASEGEGAGFSCKRKEEAASVGDGGRRAGVSCERASEGAEERTPAGVSCKRKAPASGSSPDDEDDTIPLSQLFMKKKQRRRAQPGANAESKKGPGDVQANSAGALGVDRPAISPSPVNRGIPQAVAESPDGDPKVAVSVQGTGNGGSGKNGGLSRTMPSPPPIGSTAGDSSHKNGSEGQARIGEKQRPVIPPMNRGIPETVAEHMVGSTDDPKVAAFMQGTGNCQLGKNWGLSRTRTAGNSPRKNSSKPNGSEGQVRVAEKQGRVISPVNRGMPRADAEPMVASPDNPKVSVSVQGQGAGNDHLAKNGGLSRTMPSPPPTGFTAGNSSRKSGSKPDGSEDRERIGEKQGPVAGPEYYAPIQVRTPRVTETVRRIVGSSRVGAEPPMELKNSSTDGTINMALKSIKGQEKAIGGMHKTKGVLETNGTVGKASMMLRDTREQGKPDDQVLNTKVLSRTDGIRGQGGKLSPCQSPVYTHGGRPTTTDKPVSATLQRKNQLVPHSEQMSVESSLPSAVTGHWKSSSDVLNSCLRDKELCMQAVCALHRQKKFTTQPTARGISKFDAHRVAALAEFLLDGNLQGPLKRTAEDLEKHDSTGHDFVERIVLQCSEWLFSIYRNKDDKYFR